MFGEGKPISGDSRGYEMTEETSVPHYELDTLPDVSWPRLYAITQADVRVELSRAIWGYDFAQGERYCRGSGFTEKRKLDDGLYGYFRPGEEKNGKSKT